MSSGYGTMTKESHLNSSSIVNLDAFHTGRVDRDTFLRVVHILNAGVGITTVRQMISNGGVIIIVEGIHSLIFRLIVTHRIVVISIVAIAIKDSATTTISNGGAEIDINESNIPM